jgi:hypothetical protein
MCIGVFLFVRKGKRVLLGKVKPHAAWQRLAGEGDARIREDARGWKIPARQLKLGEDPRNAARQIGEEMLGLKGLIYGEPRVEVDFWVLGKDASGPKERQKLRHFDIWFFVEAEVPAGRRVEVPAWFAALEWKDTARIATGKWARYHDDVAKRWRRRR